MSSRMQAIMLRAAVVACGAALAVGTAVAQDQTPPPPPQGQTQGPPPGGPGGPGGRGGMDPARRLERMQRELNLTPDQTAQIKGIFETERSKMEALRSSSDGQQDRRAQMMAIHEDGVTKIRGVLTPDQKTRFDAMEARQRDRMRGGPGGSGGDGAAPPPPPPPPGA